MRPHVASWFLQGHFVSKQILSLQYVQPRISDRKRHANTARSWATNGAGSDAYLLGPYCLAVTVHVCPWEESVSRKLQQYVGDKTGNLNVQNIAVVCTSAIS